MVTLVSQQRIVGDPNFENTKSDSNFASEAIHFVGAVGQKFSSGSEGQRASQSPSQRLKHQSHQQAWPDPFWMGG